VARQIIHVNTDDFFASVLRVRDPGLRRRAVVVATDSPRGIVFSASYEAREEGVRRGMSVSVARRLAPRAVFVPPDWPLFRKASSAVFSILKRYSPSIERDGLDEGFVDYTGCDRLFGPVVDVARKMKEEILSSTGLTVSLGVASNKLVSHVASRRAKRAHLVDVYPGHECDFIASTPVEEFPLVGRRRARLLHEMGVRFVGDLLLFPERLLTACFGEWGRRLYRGARGEDCGGITSGGSWEESIDVVELLEPDRVSTNVIEAYLYRASEKLGERLRGERLLVSAIRLELLYSDGVSTAGRGKVLPPTQTDSGIFEVVCSVFRRIYRRRVRVRRIFLGATVTEPQPLQIALFAGDGERKTELCRVLDKLRERFPPGVTPVSGRLFSAGLLDGREVDVSAWGGR